jgi:hypothetical protein
VTWDDRHQPTSLKSKRDTMVGRKKGTCRKKKNEKKEENENPYLLF